MIYMNRKNIALILSGGEGKRFDKSKPKQFFKINDQTILEITVEKFIKSIHPSSYLCIETRSILGENDFRYHGNNHFRNLTDINYLKELLLSNNFSILFIEERDNFAIYKEENPICIRVICKKN